MDLIKHHAMRTYRGVEEELTRMLNLGARWRSQIHAPVALPPGERAPSTHWIREWVAHRAGLDSTPKYITTPFQKKKKLEIYVL
jgi:hypothetical protein